MFKLFQLGVILFFLTTAQANAATIYVDPGVATLYRGDAITAAIRLMPDKDTGECINVVDAVVTYSENIQPVDISIGKSIFNIWVETPVINKENRTITFAGGIPNGYCGRVEGDPRLTNIIAEIIFRSPGLQIGGSDDTSAHIDFAPGTRALLNDGLGTEATLVALGGVFTLEKNPGEGIVDVWREDVRNDNIPPEEFSIELERDEEGINYNGDYYIVFSATDKQTGISHYEVMEEPVLEFSKFNWGRTDAPWIRIDGNIHLLHDQSLNSIILVKAIDKAGNEYVATLIPEESLQTISRNEIFVYAVISVLAILLTLGLFTLWYIFRKRRKKALLITDDETTIESEIQ